MATIQQWELLRMYRIWQPDLQYWAPRIVGNKGVEHSLPVVPFCFYCTTLKSRTCVGRSVEKNAFHQRWWKKRGVGVPPSQELHHLEGTGDLVLWGMSQYEYCQKSEFSLFTHTGMTIAIICKRHKLWLTWKALYWLDTNIETTPPCLPWNFRIVVLCKKGSFASIWARRLRMQGTFQRRLSLLTTTNKSKPSLGIHSPLCGHSKWTQTDPHLVLPGKGYANFNCKCHLPISITQCGKMSLTMLSSE